MELSIFLAKLMGIYLLVVGLLWAARSRQLSEIIIDFFQSPGLVFFSGLFALLAGVALAISHSVWEMSWRGAVTLFGYLSILKGVTRIGFPDLPRNAAASMIQGSYRWIWIVMALLLGAWLTWKGFTANSGIG